MTGDGAGLLIGEVAERSGVPISTLRYYERIGLLPRPPREAGRRRFPPEILDRLVIVRTAKRAGLPLDHISELLDALGQQGEPRDRWPELAARRLPELDDALRELSQVRAFVEHLRRCRCRTVHECAQLLGSSVGDPPQRGCAEP